MEIIFKDSNDRLTSIIIHPWYTVEMWTIVDVKNFTDALDEHNIKYTVQRKDGYRYLTKILSVPNDEVETNVNHI